jgi:hypothetical protein
MRSRFRSRTTWLLCGSSIWLASENLIVEVGATVLTSTFQVRGKLRVLGLLQTFLND